MAFFGIDFGTTNTSGFEINGPLRERIGQAGRPLRSVVALNQATGEVLVGAGARERQLELEAAGTWQIVPSIKRHLASQRSWVTNAGLWTPRDVASVILRALRKEAAAFGIADGLSRATFSIPVGLTAGARRVLRRAAADAGIDVTGFVTESTAVFFRYWTERQHCRYVAVFDWGGGTLDISVLEISSGGLVHERATMGLPEAGDDVDQAIALYLHSQIAGERDLTVAFEEVPSRERDLLRTRAEIAKCALSEAHEHFVALGSYLGAPVSLRVKREDLTPVLLPYVDRAIEHLARAIKQAGLSVDALDDIIVVGGSSGLWLLRDRLKADGRFDGRYRLAQDPAWDVACGAAMLDERPGAYRLSESLGLLLSDDSYYELVRQGNAQADGAGALSVSLIEDSRHANLIVDRWTDGTAPRNALQFAVPTLGFDREEIAVRYEVTNDLVFEVTAESSARGPSSRQARECPDLRFSYALGARD